MFRKRNLVALLMAAMLSLGTFGAALASDDGGANSLPTSTPEQQQQIEAGSVWA